MKQIRSVMRAADRIGCVFRPQFTLSEFFPKTHGPIRVRGLISCHCTSRDGNIFAAVRYFEEICPDISQHKAMAT